MTTLAPSVVRVHPRTATANARAFLGLAEERQVTTAFRRLSAGVGWGEANRLFDAAGLNADRSWPGKGETADELADHFLTLLQDGAAETC